MEPTKNAAPEPQEKTEFEKFQELGRQLFALPKSAAEEKPASQRPPAQKDQATDER